MMKYINSLFAVGIVACLASCSHEDQKPDAVALDARVGSVATDTRAGVSAVSGLNGKQIVLLALNKTASETGYGASGRQGSYTLTEGVAEAVTGEEIWLLKERATVYAAFPSLQTEVTASVPYVPVGTAFSMAPAIAATATRESLDFASADNDFMYGVARKNGDVAFGTAQPSADNGKTGNANDVNEYGSTISLGLRHAFAQIVLIVKLGTYSGDAELEKVVYSRSMPALSQTTKMSLVDGSLINLTAAASSQYSYDLSALNTPLVLTSGDAGKVTISNYALALDATSDSKVIVTVDGKAMEVKITSDAQWQAGSVYVYTVTVNDTGLDLTSATVVEWADQELGNVTIN